MNRQPIVQLSNLSWTFREGETRRQVLDHITFDFEPGEFVALLGQSGSGKSTLLNLISGIEKPTTGDVTINGFAITQKTERDRTLFRRDQIGIVFQFFNLIPTLTVLENITLPQELAGVSQRKAAWSLVTFSKKWAWPTVNAPFPINSPAENNNGSLFPERWRIIPCWC